MQKKEQNGTEILLEPSPDNFKPTKTYQTVLTEAGIPYTQFNVTNIQEEYRRLLKLGVEFSIKPTNMGTVIIAVFNDTCENLIQIVEEI